jgi:hypothetical protein
VQRFEWDFDMPETPFWKDIDFRVARNFCTCYDPDQLHKIPFSDYASLPVSGRLRFLLGQIQSLMTARISAVAPEAPHLADPVAWRRLLLCISTLYKFLDMPEEEAATIHAVLTITEGDARVPWLNMSADLEMRNGNFAAAESMALAVLPWMQRHEKLGMNSPQALGTTRTIIRCMWKQGGSKVEDARRLVAETDALIDDMGNGKFSKYQDEERQMLRDLVDELG